MTYEDVRYDVGDDGVATLTIARPEVMNALRPQSSVEMFDVLDDVRHNDAVRCLVITGEGRGFCAGDDFQAIFLAEDRASRKNERQIRRIKEGESSLDQIFALEKPTIAAVNGPAVGYGMDIALYCDIRIASDRAKFGWFFVRRGVMGTIGGTFILRHLVGLSKAYELTLTGDLVDADEALRIGLVNRVLPAAELMAEVKKLAATIAEKGPVALTKVKQLLNDDDEPAFAPSSTREQRAFGAMFNTQDQKEGVGAFLEKRKAAFKGA